MDFPPRNNHALLLPDRSLTVLPLVKLDKAVAHFDADLGESAVRVKEAEDVFFGETVVGEVADEHA
jgi:hypothetical protein